MNLGLLFLSFLAGILTVLAPCVFTLLPITLGGSATSKSFMKPLRIILSLSASILLFTMLLKVSTAFIDIPQSFWSYFSGTILILFGLVTLFPALWAKIEIALNLSGKSNSLLSKSSQKGGVLGDLAIGFALGPVFSSCSPTYALLVATVLPEDFIIGLIYLIAYILGLALILSFIALLGQKFVQKMKWASNPNGVFKKVLGVIFIFVGIFIFTGLDKKLETAILDSGYFNITELENEILQDTIE